MTIGILKLILFIPGSNSLKEKRMVLHSIKARLRNAFNVSVAQLDHEDKWQKATLAVAGIQKERKLMDKTLSEIVNFMERNHNTQLIDYEMEIL
jgi:uncharacterized protein YlxP (DUF503 family)